MHELDQRSDINGCVQGLTDLMYDSCFSIFGKTTSNKQKSGTKMPHGLLRNVNVRKNSFMQVNGFLKSVQILKINPDFLPIKSHFET